MGTTESRAEIETHEGGKKAGEWAEDERRVCVSMRGK